MCSFFQNSFTFSESQKISENRTKHTICSLNMIFCAESKNSFFLKPNMLLVFYISSINVLCFIILHIKSVNCMYEIMISNIVNESSMLDDFLSWRYVSILAWLCTVITMIIPTWSSHIYTSVCVGIILYCSYHYHI